VDERKHPTSPFGNDESIDPASIPAEQALAGSSVVYCGDATLVSDGFAIALHLMGIGAPVVDVNARDQPEQGE
jgi:hypothetical protein